MFSTLGNLLEGFGATANCSKGLTENHTLPISPKLYVQLQVPAINCAAYSSLLFPVSLFFQFFMSLSDACRGLWQVFFKKVLMSSMTAMTAMTTFSNGLAAAHRPSMGQRLKS
jgi:hypothetical protein